MFAQMVGMVMAAVAMGAVVAASFAFAGHPPLVWLLAYVVSGSCGLLAIAVQAGRTGPARPRV